MFHPQTRRKLGDGREVPFGLAGLHDLGDGVSHGAFRCAGAVHRGHQPRQRLHGGATAKSRKPIDVRDLEVPPRPTVVVPHHEYLHVHLRYRQHRSGLGSHTGRREKRPRPVRTMHEIDGHGSDHGRGEHDGNAVCRHRRTACAKCRTRQVPTAPPDELPTVSPSGELRQQRPADPYEVEARSRPRQANVLRRYAAGCRPKESLTFLNGLPPLFDRGEVPASTAATDHPQPSTRFIERQAAADRKGVDDRIAAEIAVTEEAMPVHALAWRERAYHGSHPGTAISSTLHRTPDQGIDPTTSSKSAGSQARNVVVRTFPWAAIASANASAAFSFADSEITTRS